ncbi:hypothetical protein [Actinoplanes derwentensis]|uniref:Uncharacterized protein n=1 Tax=Actinoplanes derwentensis TaxID=113562 RepID=A0A1H2D853_9ACTN|nr:hypothetical protein [Actinoplanes derwentensis]GID86303.1 hypothetical protein Ade03nite_52270 [Actinoplanes derwentensis]SDT78652.1 hypothetical protein SAMN04489716_8461 [Actinoplanes derwentensis]
MSEQAAGRFWSGIDVPKTVAGTLAAVSAAVLGSFLGVAGTLIGAALASLISSIGTEIYHRSIHHGTKRIQSAFVVAPAAVGTPSVSAGEESSPSDEPEAPASETGTAAAESGYRIHWKRVALITGAFFVLGMGVLTTAELFAGRSAADVTSGRENGSPTIVFDNAGDDSDDSDEEQPQVAPSENQEKPGATTKPSDTPETGVPAVDEPTQAPTTAPAATTPAAEVPETGVPEQEQDQTETDDAGQSTTEDSLG